MASSPSIPVLRRERVIPPIKPNQKSASEVLPGIPHLFYSLPCGEGEGRKGEKRLNFLRAGNPLQRTLAGELMGYHFNDDDHRDHEHGRDPIPHSWLRGPL